MMNMDPMSMMNMNPMNMMNQMNMTNPMNSMTPMNYLNQTFLMQMQFMQNAAMMQMQFMQNMMNMLNMVPGTAVCTDNSRANNTTAQPEGFKLGNMTVPPELLKQVMQMDMTPENLEKLQKVLDFTLGAIQQPKDN